MNCPDCQDTGIRPIFGYCCYGVEDGQVICGCYGYRIITDEAVCHCPAGQAIQVVDGYEEEPRSPYDAQGGAL